MKNIMTYDIYEATSYEVPGGYNGPKMNKVFFSDNEQAKYAKYVKEIIVYNGEIIDGIQFIYSDEISGQTHGNSTSTCNKFLLEANEYIINISWSTIYHQYYGGQVLKNISFRTNKNRKFEVNGEIKGFSETSYHYECKGTQEIIGLKGYVTKFFNAVTHVIYRDVNIEYNDEKYYYDDYFSIINAKKLTKICGYSGLVIDKLQFVYDNNTEVTKMHGDGYGSYFEFALLPDEYINKLIWHTAIVDYDGYGKSPVLSQLEIYTNKGRSYTAGYFGRPISELAPHFKERVKELNVYEHQAGKDEEIFCLAGVFLKYMGRITKIYNRKISSKQSDKDKQCNSDGKEVLFIYNTENMYGIGSAVKEFFDIKAIYNKTGYKQQKSQGLDKNQNGSIAYLPEPKNTYIHTRISLDDYIKAVQNRQYKYINIFNNESQPVFGMMLED